MSASVPDFLSALRRATQPVHKSLESLVDAQRLLSTRPRLEHYQRLLSAQYLLHGEFSRHLANTFSINSMHDKPVLDWPECVRLQLLERDLEALSVDIHPLEFKQLELATKGQALGMLYVCEGSCIGNQQLYAALKKHRQFVDWNGYAFLSGCKSGFAERWKTTLKLLGEHCKNEVTNPQYMSIERGALAAFELYGSYWTGLASADCKLHA